MNKLYDLLSDYWWLLLSLLYTTTIALLVVKVSIVDMQKPKK